MALGRAIFRPGQLGEINLRLRSASAIHTDADRVSAGLAGAGLPGRLVPVARVRVMVWIGGYYIMVIVSRRTVVVIRVVVPHVFVNVQRRGHGRRRRQGLNKHESNEPAHEDSLLRASFSQRPCRRTI